MNKVELLAPAGNLECLKAAINAGANACYLGGKNFSARAFANNFDDEELIQAVQYAHLRNVKIYVTLNTLLNEYEIDNAMERVDFYYKNKVDALLIQDLGLYYRIQHEYPDFELHCSTQMHVHNLAGVKTAKKLGFKRVVLARESSLQFIQEACKENIEIECFVHGAICVSYSGQCLMSSATKNRSANKGMCAQCCRLKYQLLDEKGNSIPTDTHYLLSPKDMCLLEDLPLLLDAGVSSFKIEGRMKSSAYVGYITSLYRKAIDAYYAHQKFELTEDERKNMYVLFNRRFSDDYLFSRNSLFGQQTPNHLGIEIGKAISYNKGKTKIQLKEDLNQFDGIRIGEFGCIVNKLYKNGLLVNSAKQNEIVEIETDPIEDTIVYKTYDFMLDKEISTKKEKKIPIDIHIEIYPDVPVKVKIEDFEYLSTIKAQLSKNVPLTFDTIQKQFSKLNDTPFILNRLFVNTKNAFLSFGTCNAIRRDCIDAYSKYKLDQFQRKKNPIKIVYQEMKVEDKIDFVLKDNKINNQYIFNPVINPNSIYDDSDNSIISEFGGILNCNKNKIGYYTLNVCNSYAYEFLKKLGFQYIILSTELDNDSCNRLVQGFLRRNSINIHPFILMEGRRSLMYMKGQPFIQYLKDKQSYELSDGINHYQIVENNGITELLEEFSINKKEIEDIFNSFKIVG